MSLFPKPQVLLLNPNALQTDFFPPKMSLFLLEIKHDFSEAIIPLVPLYFYVKIHVKNLKINVIKH